MNASYIFGFDFGLKWFGEAVQKKVENEISFPVKESWFVPPELAQRGPATQSGTPASKHRASKVREARKAREEWLEKIWQNAKLEVLHGRQVGKEDANGNKIPKAEWKKKKGKWVEIAKADYQLEREFPPRKPQKNKEGKLEPVYPGGKAKDGAPAETPEDFSVCYNSALLRIKLLQHEKLKPWQVFKALRSAIQKRGYGEVPWAAKEAARTGEKSKAEADKDLENESRWEKFQKGFKAWEDEKSDPNRKLIPEKFHRPCYYDAFQMGLWSPDKPEEICSDYNHTAGSTRDVRFPRKVIKDEIITLGNLAASDEQLSELKAAFEKIKKDGWLVTDEISWYDSQNNMMKRGKRVRKLMVLADNFGEFLCYGPGGKEYASYDPATVKELEIEVLEHPDPSQIGKTSQIHKRLQLRRGTDLDWLGGVGQKIPKFDNRIVEQCALIPRLHVCRVAPSWKQVKNADGTKQKQIDERSILAAEVTFLMQLKNLQVDDPASGGVRHLRSAELKEWLEKIYNEHVKDKIAEILFADGWEGKILDCFKITKFQWRKWCGEKEFEPIGVERADADAASGNDNPTNVVSDATPKDEVATKSGSKTKDDVVKSPKPNGRSRFSRPTLAILRYILLHDASPLDFAKRLRSQDEKLFDELGFDLAATPPRRPAMKDREVKGKGRPWLLFSDLDFLDRLWKQTDDKGRPRSYEPYQLRIPDMALRHLRKKHELGEKPKPYAQLLQEHFEELRRREKQPGGNAKPTEFDRQQQAIHELIGQQNNPIVRDRLTRFWRRLQHFQNPIINPDTKKLKPGLELPEPECIALEFVRDDKDNSLEGQKRANAYKDTLKKNEDRREKFRKILEADGLPTTDEMVVKRMLLEEQGGACIYESDGLPCSNLRNVQIEHIVPRSRGGPDAYWNWVLCSEDANAEKGNRTPHEWFHQEKSEADWIDFKNRVKRYQSKLGKRKVDLLLRADAAELVGEKYTSLAATSWIARVAQSIARLHFGWQPDDEPGKEKVVTISGGLTARIRRKYLLDSLLGTGDEPDALRKQVDEVLDEIDKLRQHPERHSEAAKMKWDEVRQKRSEVARNSEKNRDDQRHHALDAMLLTFLPNWARDKNKEDFFRLEDIGDNPLYSEVGEKEIAAFKSQIQKIYTEITPRLQEIKEARKAEEWEKMEQLRDSIFEQRKQLALLSKSCDKRKLPRNIRTVRNWFQEQLMGNTPVLPHPAAFQKTAIEAMLYRRAYLVRRGQMQPKRVPLSELGFRPDENKFDLKWLHARLHAIADADYDCVKLKQLLGDKFRAAVIACREQGRDFSEADWQDIVAGEDVRGLFQLQGRGKNKTLAEASACEVKVFKVDVLPVKRYPLNELAYVTGSAYTWNPQHFAEQITKVMRRVEQPRLGRTRQRIAIVPQLLNPIDATPWEGFAWDREMQSKLAAPELREEIIQTLVPILVSPDLETEERKEKTKLWRQAWDIFCSKHKLYKFVFLYEATASKPPRKPSTPLEGIVFERKDKIFSADNLGNKQAPDVVDLNLRHCLKIFADSLFQVADKHQRENLWKEFCEVIRVVTKDSLQDFISSNQIPSAQQWIEYFKSQKGPQVKQVEMIVSKKGFDEYYDLSKDGTGQFAKAGGMGGKPSNKGYLICENKTEKRIQAFPVRFFESEKTVQERLKQTGWELLDKQMWRGGELLHLKEIAVTTPKQKGKEPKKIPNSYYSLGSIQAGTGVNLNACLGGDVPKAIPLELLWKYGLRRVT